MSEQIPSIHIDYLPKLKNPLIIAAFEGWNDGGRAASNTVRQMVAAFGALPFAHIDPDEYYVFSNNRPQVKLLNGKTRREVEWQRNVFYHAQLPGSEQDVVLFLGTEPNLKWRGFGKVFLELCRRAGGEFLVTMGAYLGDVLYTLPVQVNGFSTDLQLMADHRLEHTNYEGPTGIVGALNSLAQEQNFQTLSLWAAVPYYISIPNPKAVHAILSKLCEIFSIEFDLESLQKDADSFDNEINDVVSKDPTVAAYVRELKKRDFLN